MSRKDYKCTVSYKGTAYHGWQRQPKIVTVQGMIEYALLQFFGGEVRISGASRTDAGVHAYGQVFSFQLETRIPAANIMSVLNELLPPDIRVMQCSEVEGFYSRWNVRKKFYRYVIHNSAIKYPVYEGLCWQLERRPDIEKMKAVLDAFKGEKNYTAFSSSGSQQKDFVRTVDSIKIKKQGKWILIDFMARSFLYNMIRKMTAALISHGLNELSRNEIERMFATGDRSINRHMAPPDGLYLVKIIYNKSGAGSVERVAENETQDED